MKNEISQVDTRLMAACLRHARRHRALTGTNPSVGTLLVQFSHGQAKIVGRGITAQGGRPHAERLALDRAGDAARGATAYVSLEPCAHHGATPPCAQALIDAGIARVVTAWTDPDSRVDGKGHAMLRDAGMDLSIGCRSVEASKDLAGYLNRKQKNRPQVILKLAVSSDGMLGAKGRETPITGSLARAYVHRMRAESDAIMVGRKTVEIDDPQLTCRLHGLEHRSPHRFVLDTGAMLNVDSKLAQSAHDVPVSLVTAQTKLPQKLQQAGIRHFASEAVNGRLALPELLEDMAAAGLSILMVEGGGAVARSFLEADLVDEIALFTGHVTVGGDGVVSPLSKNSVPERFRLERSLVLGDDTLDIFARV